MLSEKNHILRLTDLLTRKTCALRIELDDESLSLGNLLDKYLKNCPVLQLLEQDRITEDSAVTLQDLLDYVYVSSDSGELHGMFAGMVFKQGDNVAELESPPTTQVANVGDVPVVLTDIAIDRLHVGYDRNWTGFHRRRWDRDSKRFSRFVQNTIEQAYSPQEASVLWELGTQEGKVKFLKAVARTIWESDFENYSRFIGRKLVYKTGDETVTNIIEGRGGICSEKVQALKFITDHYGLKSEYLVAGANARASVPESKLRELLTTFDFRFSKRYMRYWQHAALLYDIDGATVLVDATNGNIPLLFMENDDSDGILRDEGKNPVTVKMAVREEDFYYHRVSQDIPEKLYFAMEGWIPDVDLIQVFDNELGLYISPEFFVTPIVFRSEPSFERLEREYVKVCNEAGLDYSISSEWTLDSPLGERLIENHPEASQKILLSKEHLLSRYDECHGAGHEAGLVLIRLDGSKNDLRDA